MTSVRAWGKRRGEWEGKGKKFKGGGSEVLDSRMSQGPALQELKAGGLPAFSAKASFYLGLHSQAPAPSRQWV